jgi:hypothetical protein
MTPAPAVAGMADKDAARRQEAKTVYNGPERSPTLPQSPRDKPIVVHGVEWPRKNVLEPIGDVVSRTTRSVRSATGDLIVEGGDAICGDNRCTPYEYFIATFPPDALTRIVSLTTEKLREKWRHDMTDGEILKFFGILILGTRYKYGSRAYLCSTSSRSTLFDPPAFGRRTGMPRDSFDLLFTLITFSKPSDQRGVSSERHRWQIVDDYESSINAHCEAHVQPSDIL